MRTYGQLHLEHALLEGGWPSRIGISMEIEVDVDRLRDYMMDKCGAAAFSGFPAAAMDAWEIEGMSGEELCREAERQGIDLRDFRVRH